MPRGAGLVYKQLNLKNLTSKEYTVTESVNIALWHVHTPQPN